MASSQGRRDHREPSGCRGASFLHFRTRTRSTIAKTSRPRRVNPSRGRTTVSSAEINTERTRAVPNAAATTCVMICSIVTRSSFPSLKIAPASSVDPHRTGSQCAPDRNRTRLPGIPIGTLLSRWFPIHAKHYASSDGVERCAGQQVVAAGPG